MTRGLRGLELKGLRFQGFGVSGFAAWGLKGSTNRKVRSFRASINHKSKSQTCLILTNKCSRRSYLLVFWIEQPVDIE